MTQDWSECGGSPHPGFRKDVTPGCTGQRGDTFKVGAFYWTALAPEIVNSGREEQDSISV